MALPTSLSLGTRVVVFGGVASAPTYFVGGGGEKNYQSPTVPGSGIPATGWPGMCVQVQGVAPDFLGSTFAVFGTDGQIHLVSGLGSQALTNATTWAANGSNPTASRWQYVDLTA